MTSMVEVLGKVKALTKSRVVISLPEASSSSKKKIEQLVVVGEILSPIATPAITSVISTGLSSSQESFKVSKVEEEMNELEKIHLQKLNVVAQEKLCKEIEKAEAEKFWKVFESENKRKVGAAKKNEESALKRENQIESRYLAEPESKNKGNIMKTVKRNLDPFFSVCVENDLQSVMCPQPYLNIEDTKIPTAIIKESQPHFPCPVVSRGSFLSSDKCSIAMVMHIVSPDSFFICLENEQNKFLEMMNEINLITQDTEVTRVKPNMGEACVVPHEVG